ncbi:MAG: tetratricopeptide repeat protein [Culturomica sp.]|jgi:tetratricopeptide (TPR) repeat protein|nr:tetratricopeptide repeat protein [Culturomica sp.]
MRMTVLILFITLCGQTLSAQQERKLIREGNEFFNKKDFEKAEVEYRKAIDKAPNSYVAHFNLGTALYRQKKYEEALREFASLEKDETDPERLGELYHNMGNTLFGMQKIDESIEAYKESLRHRPNSNETKNNLEYVRRFRQQQQQKQDQDQENKNGGDGKNQQEQNKDDKSKQEESKKQQQNQNQDQDQQKQEQQQQKSEQQNVKISEEDAKRLLEALQNDEKQVQEKVQLQKAEQQKAKKTKIDKNW